MKNNRKQQIYSMLDSLTQNEIEQYLTENKLHSKGIEEKLKELSNRKPETHFKRISDKIQVDVDKSITAYYKLGMAYVISLVLECFYDEKYKIKDLKTYMKYMIKDDEVLKEYVYDIMKDF